MSTIRRNPAVHPGGSRQSGVSLIELMIALGIGVLLTLGVVEIFSSTRAAFSASVGLSRAQEASRFAMEFMRRDVRMAGHFGCVNEMVHIPTNFLNLTSTDRDTSPGTTMAELHTQLQSAPYPLWAHRPIEVYEYTGTEAGDEYVLEVDPDPETDGGAWSPALPAGLVSLLGGAAADVMPGSDVVVVRYVDEASILLENGPNAGFNVFAGEADIVAGDEDYIDANAPYVITNCSEAVLFRASSDGAAGEFAFGGEDDDACGELVCGNVNFGKGSFVYRYHTAVYYVGQGAAGPSLYRLTIGPAGNAFGDPQELVDGVEMMQVTLGLSADGSNADAVTSYSSADELLTGLDPATPAFTGALQRIKSMRLSLLMRAPDSSVGLVPENTVFSVGDVEVEAVDVVSDGRVRQVYNSVVAVRNRIRI